MLYINKYISDHIRWFLVILLLVYGIFSFPFPRKYGVAELIIGVLLVIIVISQLVSLYSYRAKYKYIIFAFVWLLAIPSLIGILRWHISDMIRDVIPLCYIFLPLFLAVWCKSDTNSSYSEYIFPLTMMVAGGAYALRVFISAHVGIEDLEHVKLLKNYYYYYYTYVYDPSVSFAMIYGLLSGISIIHSKFSYKYIKAVILIGFALLAIGSLGGIAQRAPLGIAALMLIIYMYRLSRISFMNLFVSLVLVLAVFFLFSEQFISIFSVLVEKTEAVGINGKIVELHDILSTSSSSWTDLLFGSGWGATYYNPVIGSVIRYSHSIIGFFLLKTGIIGLSMLILYAYWLARMYINILIYAWHHDVYKLPLIFAIGSAPMIAMLQPTYKTLSFGLIMTMIPMLYYSIREQKLMDQASCQ